MNIDWIFELIFIYHLLPWSSTIVIHNDKPHCVVFSKKTNNKQTQTKTINQTTKNPQWNPRSRRLVFNEILNPFQQLETPSVWWCLWTSGIKLYLREKWQGLSSALWKNLLKKVHNDQVNLLLWTALWWTCPSASGARTDWSHWTKISHFEQHS